MITLCYVYDLISFYKQQGITMCKYWCNWPIIGATLAQCIMPRPGKCKMLTQCWPNSDPFQPTLHVRYHNECIRYHGDGWESLAMDYGLSSKHVTLSLWMLNVSQRDQCDPHRSMWSTQINVSQRDQCDPHRSMWATDIKSWATTQINVSHTDQCEPYRFTWATQINVSHTDQCEPHWSMSATQINVSHTDQYEPHRSMWATLVNASHID